MNRVVEVKNISWSHASSPTNEDAINIIREYKISPLDAELIAHSNQGPECIIRENYTIILIRIPVVKKQDVSLDTYSLYFLIQERRLLTIADGPILALDRILKEFTSNPNAQQEYFEDTPLSLALHIIDRLNTSSLKKIHSLVKHVEIAEDAIFHGNEKKMVEEIALLSRDVLDFHRIALPQVGLFTALQHHNTFSKEEKNQLERVVHQSEQMWNLLQVLHSSAQELRNNNDSILQHKENELLRMIFSYSIVTIPFLILSTQFDPRHAGATLSDIIIFWSIFTFLFVVLIVIFFKARRGKVL